ncbi:MAG: hypothetical protein DMG05_29390 [Acidobacteria bacterium]|nr:MAG: hypothetical protein DMG05_29390 [Acidobacteriota bacterium]
MPGEISTKRSMSCVAFSKPIPQTLKFFISLIESTPTSEPKRFQIWLSLLRTLLACIRSLQIEIDPKLSGIHHALGVAILHSSRDEASRLQAQGEFELELAVNPGAAHSEYQLGEIYWLGSRPEEALKHFTRALELQSSFVDAQIALGKVWISQGQPAKALTFLQQAVRIDPENEVAHYRLAEAYRKLGRNQEGAAEMALFKKLREASSSIASIYRQVQQTPITVQTVEATELP